VAHNVESDRPWTEMNIQVHPNVSAVFSFSVISIVGDGTATSFWTDPWLHGQSIQDLAYALLDLVPKRIANKRTVQEAMEDLQWVTDIRGSLPAQAFFVSPFRTSTSQRRHPDGRGCCCVPSSPQ
jgi:hypothetical protein